MSRRYCSPSILKFAPDDPDWPDRDRFVLSAGHGSMLLYGLLHLTGYAEMTLDELKRFRQLGAVPPAIPSIGFAKGIETTTGPLGQGLANAVGMALAERLLAARFGDALVDHHTYVIAGDGCLMEGISHEAISLAGHLRLAKLTVLWDDKSISIDGATDLSVSDNQLARFAASGWTVERIDGHDTDAVSAALTRRGAATGRRSSPAAPSSPSAPRPRPAALPRTARRSAPEIAGAPGTAGLAVSAFEVPDDIAGGGALPATVALPSSPPGDSALPRRRRSSAPSSCAGNPARCRPAVTRRSRR